MVKIAVANEPTAVLCDFCHKIKSKFKKRQAPIFSDELSPRQLTKIDWKKVHITAAKHASK